MGCQECSGTGNAGNMKNYYSILGLQQKADAGEIRKAYRRLAMQNHPDRNPGDPEAAARFTEIAEAYGVLSDPKKRQEYDACKGTGGTSFRRPGPSPGGFSYSQEDILRDLMRDPIFQQMFHGVLREFQQSGMSSGAVPRTGRIRGFFLRWRFFFNTLRGARRLRKQANAWGTQTGRPRKAVPTRSFSGKIGDMLNRLLGKRRFQKDGALPERRCDITYKLPVREEELSEGIVADVVCQHRMKKEMFRVHVPSGSHYGQRLRLKGHGRLSKKGRGDLYLRLCRPEEVI